MSWCFLNAAFWSIIVILLTVIYFYIKHSYSYWKRRGVNSVPITFPFGNFKETFLLRHSVGHTTELFYNESSDPFFGVYVGTKPILILRDPDILRDVLIRDFQHFHDRGVYFDEKIDPLTAHLFAIEGQKWKSLRMRLTPTFTSGKLKAMFATLVECGKPLQNYISNLVKENKELDVRELSASYSTNVIASVAFGIDINCIDNPNTDFRVAGRKIFDSSGVFKGLQNFFRFVFPSFLRYFRLRIIPRDVNDFMFSLVQEMLNYREKSGVVRKDFFQLLVQLRNTGTVQLDDQWETTIAADESLKTLTVAEVAAQSYIFFLAGFETSSTTLSFCMFEIAKNAEIQAKVHEEIDRVLAEHDGQISYQSISDMKYLESCMDETLRKYPPVPTMNRICTRDYTIPGTSVTIEKGTPILIPVLGLHKDPKYYPNPEEFIPERFSAENQAIHTFTDRPYLPFGEGPRNCIGLRMGKMQTKTGLVLMLEKHRYELAPRHIGQDLKLQSKAFLLAVKGGLSLTVHNR